MPSYEEIVTQIQKELKNYTDNEILEKLEMEVQGLISTLKNSKGVMHCGPITHQQNIHGIINEIRERRNK